MVTMKDVAKAAGVSQAAVSYAYSGSPKVSAAQRDQILAVAADLGYPGPSIAGASLRSGRMGTVGVIIPGSLALAVEDPSTTLLLKGIVEAGELAGVALTLLPADDAATTDPARLTQSGALRGLVDGVVMHCLPDGHPVVAAILARGIPAVAIDSPQVPHLPYVTVDHHAAGVAQANHLLTQGHRRIGIITDRLGPVPQPGFRMPAAIPAATERYLRERLTGVLSACRDAHISDTEIAIVESAGIDRQSGLAAAEQLIAGFAPTAVLTTSDVHAAAALRVLATKGIAVPQQASVIGFDDAPIADLLGLTTIRQPLVDKGRTAATILLDVIGGRTRRRSVKPTELIVRTTTGPAPR
jgi:DNA-binding LacI/PurR family transcriptional regulator